MKQNDEELDARLEEQGADVCSCDECRQLDLDSHLAESVLKSQRFALDKIYALDKLAEEAADKDPDVADAQ